MTGGPLGGLRGRPLLCLVALATVSEAAYLAVALSGQSLHEEGPSGHSLLAILGLFALAFAGYLAAIHTANRAPQDARLLGVIAGGAVLFRLTLLASDPIEEIDLYRYLWDGAVLTEGVSPFRFSPAQVLAAPSTAELPADLGRLVALRDRSPALRTILGRIHFADLATIYPPVSQAVFGLATLTTPAGASVSLRMGVLKAWFVGFDLGTLALLVALLWFTGRPVGGSLAYGWCPLVLKEVANSGHLDALAVFLTTLAAYLAVRSLHGGPGGKIENAGPRRPSPLLATSAALALAMAVGAKLYPMILAPLFGISLVRRLGWRGTIVPAAVFGLSTALLLWPMLPVRRPTEPAAEGRGTAEAEDLPPLPPWESFSEPPAPEAGLSAFASEWEMNDFLFLFLMENLRPHAALPPRERAWFSVVPERWRSTIVEGLAPRIGIESGRLPFFLSRSITTLIVVVLALKIAWNTRPADGPGTWLGAVFLTLAWFWLLLPTLNPWYWTWAVPLLPFARNRAWTALSGLVLLYYLRFWLTYHLRDTPVLGTRYPGPLFFDYVVTWLEYGPWLLWLAWEARAQHVRRS